MTLSLCGGMWWVVGVGGGGGLKLFSCQTQLLSRVKVELGLSDFDDVKSKEGIWLIDSIQLATKPNLQNTIHQTKSTDPSFYLWD